MSQQMAFTTLGGEVITVKQRGKHYVQPRGYAWPPGTGPAGETCGSCKHLFRNRLAKTYLKCSLTRAAWTGGRASDVLAGAAACKKWERP
jgi:hypothetical protein